MSELNELATLLADANCRGYWRLEGDATDSKGTNHGTRTAITDISGKYGQGAQFTAASSSRILFGHVAAYNNLPLTVGFWHKDPAWSTWSTVNKYVAGSNNGWGIDVQATSVNYIYSPNTTSDRIIGGVGGIPTMNDGAWHLVIVEFTTATAGARVFTDNVDRGTSNWPTGTHNAVSTTQALTFGQYPGDAYGGGKLDEVFIFDRLLTTAEKTLLWNDGSLPAAMFFRGGLVTN